MRPIEALVDDPSQCNDQLYLSDLWVQIYGKLRLSFKVVGIT